MTANAGGLFLAVVVVLVIVAIVVVTLDKKSRHEDFATEDENGKTLQDLSSILQAGVNSFFTKVLPSIVFVSDDNSGNRIPIPSGSAPVFNAPFEGTLNNLDLRTWVPRKAGYDYLVEGSGTERVVIPKKYVIPDFDVHYTYRLDAIYDLLSQLQLSVGAPVIEISDVDSGGSQTVLLRMIGHIGSLKGKPTTSANANISGIKFESNCSEFIWLKNVYVYFTFKFSISGCGTAPRVTSLTLADVAFTVESVDYRCTATLAGLGIYTLDMADYVKKPIVDALNSKLRNVLIDLMRDHFSQLSFPLLFCLRLPSGCIPGIVVGNVAENTMIGGIINDVTYAQCKSICAGNDACMAAYQEWGEASGRKGKCLLYSVDILANKGKQPIQVPYGDIWIKKSASKPPTDMRHVIPNPGSFNPSFNGRTTGLDLAGCESVARSNGATAWSHDGGTCYMYKVPYEFQKSTLDIFGHCGKIFKSPNKFVFS